MEGKKLHEFKRKNKVLNATNFKNKKSSKDKDPFSCAAKLDVGIEIVNTAEGGRANGQNSKSTNVTIGNNDKGASWYCKLPIVCSVC